MLFARLLHARTNQCLPFKLRVALVCAAMATEIERKFLVRDDTWRARVEKQIVIRQFYLAVTGNRSVRVRISDETSARLTLKFGSHTPVREEFEYDIPLPQALEMERHAVGVRIDKIRHHVRHGGYLYEVDVFSGRLDGLIVAELETADTVPVSALPAWIGREVTGDMRYSNAMLALSCDIPGSTIRALAG